MARGLLDLGHPALAFIVNSVQNTWAFLYGGLAPDLFIAKNRQVFEHHTHNWAKAFEMYQKAEDEEERAFALGYLLHLAADTVAHNNYVPYKMLEDPMGKKRTHAYWEVRFEHTQPLDSWKAAVDIQKSHPAARLHGFLKQHQKPTMLSFESNVMMTRGMNRLGTNSVYRAILDTVAHRSPIPIPDTEARLFMDRARKAMLEVLDLGADATICQKDPRGMNSIRVAEAFFKDIRRIYRRPFVGRTHYRDLGQRQALSLRSKLLEE